MSHNKLVRPLHNITGHTTPLIATKSLLLSFKFFTVLSLGVQLNYEIIENMM